MNGTTSNDKIENGTGRCCYDEEQEKQRDLRQQYVHVAYDQGYEEGYSEGYDRGWIDAQAMMQGYGGIHGKAE